jgi:hypothetical protein
MYLIRSPGDSTVSVLIRAVAFSAAIVPLMYLTDSLTYRWYQKRLANRAAAAAGSPPKKK